MYGRTFFVTTVTHARRPWFQVERHAALMLDVMARYERQRAFAMHAFVIMPDHLHLLLTPATDISLERAIQRLKGGYSFCVRTWLRGALWQPSFMSHRVNDARDFHAHLRYIHLNPVRRGLCTTAADYPFSSAHTPPAAPPKTAGPNTA